MPGLSREGPSRAHRLRAPPSCKKRVLRGPHLQINTPASTGVLKTRPLVHSLLATPYRPTPKPEILPSIPGAELTQPLELVGKCWEPKAAGPASTPMAGCVQGPGHQGGSQRHPGPPHLSPTSFLRVRRRSTDS